MRMNPAFTDANVYRIDVSTGAMRQLTHHKGAALEVATSISPDGKTLLITSNARDGRDNVALMDAASGTMHWVTHTDWSADAGGFSADGRWFDYLVNADGRVTTFLVDRNDMKARALHMPTGLTYPTGRDGGFSPDGKRLLVSFQNAQRPADLWVYDPVSRHARQLTHSSLASLRPDDIPPARLVHYRSFDGTLISAYVWVPYNLRRDGSHPAVVLPHGGPAGQVVDRFNPLAAALASRGYLCIAANVRGSSGYGATFQKMNYQDLGGGDLKDEVYARKFLIDTGYVDPHKVGITGGSYGGFMTLMAIGKTPGLWAAAVSRYGIIDWLAMLEKGDPLLHQYERTLLGDPVKDRQAYVDASPITYIDRVKAPLLVLQGVNDKRVPKEQAEQVVRTLRKKGRTVKAHYYAHEGHGFVRREDRIDDTRRTLAWFDKYLKGTP
jgi:dipeptidyl aminopeptidase/acylaminoacyl peptidase